MKYILTGKNKEVKVIFSFDLNGFITSFEISGVENEDQLRFLFWNAKFPFPYVESLIKQTIASGFFYVKNVPDDISFDAFWDLYANKVARLRAAKEYKKLSYTDKVAIFLHLPHFKAENERKGYDLPYPDKYLRNRRWEDDK